MTTIPEQVQDRCIEIAGLPAMEQPPEIQAAWEEFRPHGYTKGDIRTGVAQASAVSQQQQLMDQGGDLIKEMNQEWFVMATDNKTRIGSIRETKLNGHRVRSLSMLTKQDFSLQMSNRIVAGETADNIWLAHPERREYNGFFTHPEKPTEHEGKLNLWAGFSVEPKRGSIKPLVEHITNLVGGDKDAMDYVLNWMAYGFQHPHKPIGTVIVLIGDQGTGKGLLGNLLWSMFGQHGVSIRKQEDLIGKHNAHLMSACFAFVDEALFAGNKQVADVLKGLVTEPTIAVEPKFQDRYYVDNMLNLLCASNHDHAMQIEFSDRRYVVFGVPDGMANKSRKHWRDLAQWMSSEEAKAAILWHMLRRDVSEFDPEGDRPFTEFYKRQKLASLQDDWLWWRNVAQRKKFSFGPLQPELDAISNRELNDGRQMSKALVYDLYCDWVSRDRGGFRAVGAEVFWRNAKRWLFTDQDFRKAGGKGKQVRVVFVPEFDVIEQRLDYFLKHKKPMPVSKVAGVK